jgi:hypothetical protein
MVRQPLRGGPLCNDIYVFFNAVLARPLAVPSVKAAPELAPRVGYEGASPAYPARPPGCAAVGAGPVSEATSNASAHLARLKLLVFEHADCRACRLLRQDLTAFYEQAGYAAAAPLRFVDIAQSDITTLELRGPLTVVPTTVLMREGQEVDRISGYWSREDFGRMLAYLIARG